MIIYDTYDELRRSPDEFWVVANHTAQKKVSDMSVVTYLCKNRSGFLWGPASDAFKFRYFNEALHCARDKHEGVPNQRLHVRRLSLQDPRTP